MKTNLPLILTILLLTAAGIAQPPKPRPPGSSPGVPHPRAEGHTPGRPGMPPRPGLWFLPHDENNNGILEAAEFSAAIERTFGRLDKDKSGVLEAEEIHPEPIERRSADDFTPPGPAPQNRMLPPFFLDDARNATEPISRAEFERLVMTVFSKLDENGDGLLSTEEAAKHRPPHPAPPAGPPHPPMPPHAQFIGAEIRFGEKLVKEQPFSAEILIQETRRLFDGTTVSKENHGAIYRDSSGRTRREQPLEMIAGVQVVGMDNKPQMLVFINDFASRSHIFLDMNNKVARKGNIQAGAPPAPERTPREAKTQELGTKTIEGIDVEGTLTTFEIPAGQIGNDKPIQVTSERWYSPKLQVTVSSRHVDPIAGEHVFNLRNIKLGEPSAELFVIPSGYRIQN